MKNIHTILMYLEKFYQSDHLFIRNRSSNQKSVYVRNGISDEVPDNLFLKNFKHLKCN